MVDRILFWASLSIYMARVHSLQRKSTLVLRRRRLAIVRSWEMPSRAIRASVVERFGTCGTPGCGCHTGTRHGPYYYLTQCVAKGTVRKFLLKSPESQQLARACVEAFNSFYDTLEELSQINLELLRRGEPLPEVGP